MSDLRPLYEKTRFLIVEDERYTREIIIGLLHQLGARLIHEAPDGNAGFIEFMRVKPAIVLCDVHMQPVDGLQFLTLVRELTYANLARTPVIFLTADKQQETVVSAKKLQVDGYLVKPVSFAALKTRLDPIVQRVGPAL